MMTQSGQWIPSYAGQQPLQDPEFIEFMRRQNIIGGNGQSQQGQQRMTPPIIHADIIQIGSLDEMNQYPVTPGSSQMFMTRDEQIIAVRSMYNNGHSDDYYDKRPPEPPAPTLNPAEYVRRDELAALIAEALQAQQTPQTTRRTAKKDEEAA